MSEKEEFKNQIEKIVGKSRKALKTAKNNFNNDDYETASSKAYYAVFHIMQAALKKLTYSKHSGVISGFSREFIKTGIFPKDFSKKIRGLLQDREISDYSYSFTVETAEAQQDIEVAEEIVKVVESYLKEKLGLI